MKLKAISEMVFVLLLLSMLILAFNVAPATGSTSEDYGAVWVSDGWEVIKLSSDGTELFRVELGSNLRTVSVNPTDGSVWVAVFYGHEVVRLSADGEVLVRAGGYSWPKHVATDPNDGSAWIGLGYFSLPIYKVDANGNQLLEIPGFRDQNTNGMSVDPNDGSAWIADRDDNEVVKLSSTGVQLVSTYVAEPTAVSNVNPNDGTLWVQSLSLDELVKLSSDGTVLLTISGFPRDNVVSMSIDPNDGSVWVAGGNQLVKLSSTGEELLRLTGFSSLLDTSVDPRDGSVWLGDYGTVGEVIKLASDGIELLRVGGFTRPCSVSVYPGTVPTKKLSIKLSGEHDYLFKENVKIRLAALVTDAETTEPVSGANVTIEIYDPEGDQWISDNMTEKLPDRGIYEWNSTKTIRKLITRGPLSKGVYLVVVQASYEEGPVSTDILEFHIDPPLEEPIQLQTILLFLMAGALVIVISGWYIDHRRPARKHHQLGTTA